MSGPHRRTFFRGLEVFAASVRAMLAKASKPVVCRLVLPCATLNCLFLDKQLHKIPDVEPTSLQVEALRFLLQDVTEFFADCDGPLEPTSWDEVMRKSAVSYTGEEVYPAEDLSPSRLDQSFPDPRYGGAVPVLSVVEGCLRRQLMDPENLLLPEEQWGGMPARARRVCGPTRTHGIKSQSFWSRPTSQSPVDVVPRRSSVIS